MSAPLPLHMMREAAGGLYRWYQYARFRASMRRRDVSIHRGAKVYAARGVVLGADTFVYGGAVVAATCLNYEDRLDSAPQGRIAIGRRCTIMPNAIVAAYGGSITLGDDVSINPGVVLYGHGGVVIGNKTRIAAQTLIVSANHVFTDTSKPIMDQGLDCKGIVIGDDTWIGAQCVILDGVTIGAGSVIAAGTVVTKNVASGAVVAGVPARLIKERLRLS